MWTSGVRTDLLVLSLSRVDEILRLILGCRFRGWIRDAEIEGTARSVRIRLRDLYRCEYTSQLD